MFFVSVCSWYSCIFEMSQKKAFYFLFIVLNGLQTCNNTQRGCKKHECISKCCFEDSYVDIYGNSYRCVKYNNPAMMKGDFTDLQVYEYDMPEENINKTRKTVNDLFRIVARDNEKMKTYYDTDTLSDNNYIMQDGRLIMKIDDKYKIVDNSNFCVDYDAELNIGIWYTSGERNVSYFKIVGLIISSIFILITLVIYLISKDLKSLRGIITMAILFSLLGAFVGLTAILLMDGQHPTLMFCICITGSVYFFFISSLCWMNVVSFDFWCDIRTFEVPHLSNKVRKKFLIRCCYAVGVPFSMTTMLLVIIVHYPNLLKPNIPDEICFFAGDAELFYLHIPMLILIVINWSFFIISALIIRKNSTSPQNLPRRCTLLSAIRNHKEKIKVYAKLSVIMALTWVLEIISSFKPDLPVWYITDTYNMLIGVLIFLLFGVPRIRILLAKNQSRHIA